MPPRADDPTIEDHEPLWRRILPLPGWIHRNPDGSFRPSSMAFLDNIDGELSVHLANLTSQEAVLRDRATESIAELLASVPRSLGYAIVRDPTPEDASHALICPPANTPENRRKKHARFIAAQCRWVCLRMPASS
jgi:hypothetical protein